MRKPWVACIEPKLGCEDTLAGLFNVFHIKVDGKERTVKAPMKRLWDMIDADIEFKRSGTLNNHGTLCFRLEFLGMLMSRTAFSDVSESRMSHPTFSDVSGSRMSNATFSDAYDDDSFCTLTPVERKQTSRQCLWQAAYTVALSTKISMSMASSTRSRKGTRLMWKCRRG